MRTSFLGVLAGALAVSHAQSLDAEVDAKSITKFNSIDVPPPLELTPSNWEAETKKSKYLMIKHFR